MTTPPSSPFVVPPWASPRRCYAVLVEPPTEEPIDLATAKLLAGLDWATTDPPDPRDKMMNDFIKAARNKVEQDTNLALLTQTHDVHVLVATCCIPLPPQCSPTQSIEDVTPAGTRRATVASTGVALTSTVPVAGVWRVVSGWPTVDELAAAAPLLVHAVGLLTAHYATLGRDLASIEPSTEVPQGYEDAIASYRPVTVA